MRGLNRSPRNEPSPLGGEGRVSGFGVADLPLNQNPLTPTLSPLGRGGLAGASE
jgi:hypothetical protein